MKLDDRLKAAIANYFAKKYHDGSGAFRKDEKYPAINLIGAECKRLDFSWEIVPGLIIIHVGPEGSIWFDRYNQETGTFIANGTKNPWREMDKDRTVKTYEFYAERLDALNGVP